MVLIILENLRLILVLTRYTVGTVRTDNRSEAIDRNLQSFLTGPHGFYQIE